MSNKTQRSVVSIVTRTTVIACGGLVLAAAVSLSGIAWAEGGLYDTHPQKIPDKAKVEDCGALDEEISRLAKFARNPAATPKQIEANKGRVAKLEVRRTNAKCPGKVKS
jgi:hypothetical protein